MEIGMGEKERYYINKILRDCIMPEGLFKIKDRECKEWYLIIEGKETTDKIVNLLNQQDKRNKKLCQQIIDLNKENNKLRKFRDDVLRVQAEPYQFYKENQQLKQSQNQIAIEKLRCVKEYILINDEYDEEVGCNTIKTFDLLEDIRHKIEELGGEQKDE